MPAAEVRGYVKALDMDLGDLADELSIHPRTIRRWLRKGVDGSGGAALRYAARLDALGICWRKRTNEIVLGAEGWRAPQAEVSMASG